MHLKHTYITLDKIERKRDRYVQECTTQTKHTDTHTNQTHENKTTREKKLCTHNSNNKRNKNNNKNKNKKKKKKNSLTRCCVYEHKLNAYTQQQNIHQRESHTEYKKRTRNTSCCTHIFRWLQLNRNHITLACFSSSSVSSLHFASSNQ